MKSLVGERYVTMQLTSKALRMARIKGITVLPATHEWIDRAILPLLQAT